MKKQALGLIAPYRLPVYLACTLLAISINYILGKDMAWDTLNYHLYLGFSALNDRFGQDYFAAGLLSYLNPYAYVPFYAMVSMGLPALAIGSILAALHSVILWLTFELGMTVCPATDNRSRASAGACAIALALINPVLLQQIGSCFADITTAELALAGWLLVVSAVRMPRITLVICGGLILGATGALKLSNMVAAVAASSLLFLLPLGWHGKIRHGVAYGAALCVGFVLVATPWSYRLVKEFGNPLFPMFNNIFRSPYFTAEPLTVYRFIPESLAAALWRPFAMINPVAMVHEELRAPDPRYAIVVVFGLLWLFRFLWHRRRQPSSLPMTAPMGDSTRVLAALGLGLGVYWVLWLRTSGNSRYVLTMACIAAVVIVGLLFQLFKSQPKVRAYILIAVFATQAMQLNLAAEYRWNGVPWGGPWFKISAAKTLVVHPTLYLTLGAQSNSFIAPFLAKNSGFVNFAGGYTLDSEDANGIRVKALIRRFSPDVRIVVASRTPSASQADDALQRFGLKSDMSDCAGIEVHGLPSMDLRKTTLLSADPGTRVTTYLSACKVVPDTNHIATLVARQHEVNLVFDRLEDACPQLFKPRRLVSLHDGDIWRRLYGSTDISAWISHGRLKFENLSRPNGITDLGSERDWQTAAPRLECGFDNGVYFAHVAGLKE